MTGLAQSYSQVFTGCLFSAARLTPRRLGIYLPSRSDQRGAPVSSSAQERDATDPSRLWAFRATARREVRQCKVVKGRRPADEVGGPRTQQCGVAKHSVKAPSSWRRWELQADKTVACGTQAFPACEAAAARQLAVCCSNRTRCHVPGKHMMPRAHPRGAAGAVKRPVFRTPLRGRRNKETCEPRAGDERGAMTRV